MCAIFYFLIFSGQFWASENSTPGPSEAEKLIGWGKKKLPLAPEKQFLEPIQKNTLVGWAMFLKDCVYQG